MSKVRFGDVISSQYVSPHVTVIIAQQSLSFPSNIIIINIILIISIIFVIPGTRMTFDTIYDEWIDPACGANEQLTY